MRNKSSTYDRHKSTEELKSITQYNNKVTEVKKTVKQQDKLSKLNQEKKAIDRNQRELDLDKKKKESEKLKSQNEVQDEYKLHMISKQKAKGQTSKTLGINSNFMAEQPENFKIGNGNRKVTTFEEDKGGSKHSVLNFGNDGGTENGPMVCQVRNNPIPYGEESVAERLNKINALNKRGTYIDPKFYKNDKQMQVPGNISYSPKNKGATKEDDVAAMLDNYNLLQEKIKLEEKLAELDRLDELDRQARDRGDYCEDEEIYQSEQQLVKKSNTAGVSKQDTQQDKRKLYKEQLDQQRIDNKNYKLEPESKRTNLRDLNAKKRNEIDTNPYSTKNFDIKGTGVNPHLNPNANSMKENHDKQSYDVIGNNRAITSKASVEAEPESSYKSNNGYDYLSEKRKKNQDVMINPYSTKNYNILGEGISDNPILNPGRQSNYMSYNVRAKNVSRGDSLKNAGNNIIG